jgi:PAS domain S-box-containing protein
MAIAGGKGIVERLRRGGVAAYLLWLLGVAALYIVTGKLGLMLSVPPGFATLIWPPSGLALGICLVHGRRYLPGIWVGSFLLNAHVAGAFGIPMPAAAPKLMVAATIAAGSTAQILIACALAARFIGRPLKLVSVEQIFRLFLLVGPLACVTAASVGVLSLRTAGLMAPDVTLNNWLSWWGGDVFGVIVFLPLALIAPGNRNPIRLNGNAIGRISALTLFLILIPLGLTFYAWKIVSIGEYKAKEQAFTALTEESEKALGRRMDAYNNALVGAAAFWKGQDRVGHAEWKTYVDALDIRTTYPGISGLGLVEPAATGELDALQARVKADGVRDFKVHPAVPGDNHFVITYVEPLETNRPALGLDLAFEPNRLAAALKARDTGQATITRKLYLVQEKEQTPGFLLLYPLFGSGHAPEARKERPSDIRGWIYAPFIARNLLGDLTRSQGSQIELEIYDQDRADAADLIYRSGDAASAGAFMARRHIHIGQATWLVVWKSTKAFDNAGRSVTPALILSAGLLFTAMLAVLLFGMSLKDADLAAGRKREPFLIPATVFLIVLLGSVFTYRTLSVQEDHYAGGLMERDASRIQELLGSRADDDVKILKRVAARLTIMPDGPDAVWRADARRLERDVKGLEALIWVDAHGHIRLSEPEPTANKAGPRLPSRALFDLAARRGLPTASAVEPQPDGSSQFSVVSPLRDGYLVAVFDAGIFVNSGLTGDLKSNYQVGIVRDGPDILLNAPGDTVVADKAITRTLPVADADWVLGIRPTEAVQASERSSFPLIALVAGLAIAVLCALTVQALLVLNRKSRELVLSNHRLATSEETFRLAMENAPIGKALVGPDGRWLSVNNALCDLLGYDRPSLLAMDFQTITHPDDLEADMALVRQVMAGELTSYSLEKRYIHKDGRTIWGLLRVSLVRKPDGAPGYFVSQIQDITERREMERMKSEFISTVSHELRTPLTSIRGSLDFVASSSADALDDAGRRLLDMARRNCDRLVLLINDILDIDKIASGTMRFDIRDEAVDQLVEQCVALNQGFAGKLNVRLLTGRPLSRVSAAVDPARFQQALTNLVSNAVKFSPAGGTVLVTAALHEGKVVVSVQDEGPGIPADFRARIFGRFAQADSSSTRAKGGSGLGLHITREIVEHMGGTIGFDSIEGQGATFWMAFPATVEKENVESAA